MGARLVDGRPEISEQVRGDIAIGSPIRRQQSVEEHERFDPLGLARGERNRREPAFRISEHHGAVGADRVEHRNKIRRALFQRRRRQNRIGQAGTRLVEQDHAAEATQAFQHVRRPPISPPELNMRHRPAHEQEITGAVTEHLIRDAETSMLRVSNIGPVHAPYAIDWLSLSLPCW